jgi:purine-binding chemotaxis protein CheW
LAESPSVSATGTETTVDFACFEARGRVYGIEVLQIREIVRSQEVTPLPRAPELIEGVIDLRGVVIPVIDLGRVLCGQRAEEGSETRIAILEVDGMVLSLRVDAAVDVISVEASDVDEPPALATHAGYDTVRAVVRRADAPPVLILSLEHLLESVYRSPLPSAGVET